jgi:hypothetical protein
MYHPYFRGKQFELITIRDNAKLLRKAGFVPIVEPVKQSLSSLKRAIDAVAEEGGKIIVVVNPFHGNMSKDGKAISSLVSGYANETNVVVGILLKENMSVADVQTSIDRHADHEIALIHAGFTQAKALAESFGDDIADMLQIFFEANCGKLYRKHFSGCDRILLRDGFIRRKNKDHPSVEEFSDLHITFKDEGMDGFGDFLIVGDDFAESGGPAYAIAIHLTYIDDEKDDAMYVRHFKSKRFDTPTDPAGKFAEALDAMMKALAMPNCKILETKAVKEFRELHKQGHFPGLGYVKKLSMQHHIETLADFL